MIKRYTLYSSLLLSVSLYADISGVVYEDLPATGDQANIYGVQEANEQGVRGVTVTAFPEQISTITDANGSWTLPTTQDSRVEFSNWADYLLQSPDAQSGNSAVQFVQDGTQDVSLGLYSLNNYLSNPLPPYTTNIISKGSGMNNALPALVTNQYTDTELNHDFSDFLGNPGTGNAFTVDALANGIGTVWGKAYQPSTQNMFIASVLWRHAGFAQGSPSTIWVANYTANSAQIIRQINLQGVSGIDLGTVQRSGSADYILSDSPVEPSIDLDAYAKIGKISYGDLDIDHTTQTLWTVNLNQRALIRLDASKTVDEIANTAQQYLLESLPGVPQCTNGVLRPWGLGIHKDQGYIGSVCDASSSQDANDLIAYVSAFDLKNPEAGLESIITIPLNYSEGRIDTFFPWTDLEQNTAATFWDDYNQPILSDIEFDEKGNMYLAFSDRYAMQIGFTTYTAHSGSTDLTEQANGHGEIFRVCNINGIYALEGTSFCSANNIYGDNDFFEDKGGGGNLNSIGGALGIVKGSNQILATANDPHPSQIIGQQYWYLNGILTLSTNSGAIENWYAHLFSGVIPELEGAPYTGKSTGLGDIEFISDPAPLELGNRVWHDVDANGIQDANESGIANVNVQLMQSETVIDTAQTNREGYYIFSNDALRESDTSHRYNLSALLPNNNYRIIIENAIGADQQAALQGLTLTLMDQGEGNNSNRNDSDAQLLANQASINITPSELSNYGINNHSFDIGFTAATETTPPVALYTLGDYVWYDSNQNGMQESNESGVENVTVSLYTTANCTEEVNQTATTDATGHYQFTALPLGSYCLQFRLPDEYNVTTSNLGNDSHDSDANATGYIPNINLENNTTTFDVGIHLSTPPSDPEEPVIPIIPDTNSTAYNCFGDRVWNDANRNGLQDNNETGISNITVTLYEDDCTTELNQTTTDQRGNYLFSGLASGTYCVGFSNFPAGYIVTFSDQGEDEGVNSDLNRDTNKTQPFTLNQEDNLTCEVSIDAGLFENTLCSGSVTIQDDQSNANENSATTHINVMSNDTLSTGGDYTVRLIDPAELEALGGENITHSTVALHNNLVVPGEGEWEVIDNMISFTAYPEFDGQIPSPVYYTVEHLQCNAVTPLDMALSNVGKIEITTPCVCKDYTEKSVPSLTVLGAFLFLILFSVVAIRFIAQDKKDKSKKRT